MLRLITYLIAFLKLLLMGKWYPPAHVRDVSAADFVDLLENVSDLRMWLEACQRQTEATRKKVYREEAKISDEELDKLIPKPEPSPKGAPGGLVSGDFVPEGLF